MFKDRAGRTSARDSSLAPLGRVLTTSKIQRIFQQHTGTPVGSVLLPLFVDDRTRVNHRKVHILLIREARLRSQGGGSFANLSLSLSDLSQIPLSQIPLSLPLPLGSLALSRLSTPPLSLSLR